MPFDLTSITSGKKPKPPMGIIYGAGKIGKTTFASQAPNPIFLPTEEGTDFLDVSRFPIINSVEELFEAIKTLGTTDHTYKTVVLDSADHLEVLVHEFIVRKEGVPLEKINGGYYRWRDAARIVWRDILNQLNKLRERKGMGILIIAHFKTKDVPDPRSDTYSRIMLKLDDSAAAFLCESVDFIGFAGMDIKAVATNDEDRKRGVATGERKLFLVEQPAFVAGNRMGLPSSIPLSWNAFAEEWMKVTL